MVGATLLAAVLAVAATACSDDDDDDDGGDATSAPTADATTDGSDTANAQLCEDLADLQTSVQALQELGSDSTIDEVQAALQAVQTASDDVESSAAAVAQAEASALATALEDFGDTVQNLSGTDTVGDAQTDVQTAADEVSAARDDLATRAECS
jgi:hypothetical protein